VILVDTFVAGLPRTKGSLAKRPNGTLYDSVVDSGKWRALMAGAVRDDMARRFPGLGGAPDPWRHAVRVDAVFWLPVDPLAYGAGDLDKLTRNLLDALGTRSKNPRYNGGVIIDDNQVVHLDIRKLGPSDRPGVHVIVSALDMSAMHARLEA
jgi:hypothetical protein